MSTPPAPTPALQVNPADLQTIADAAPDLGVVIASAAARRSIYGSYVIATIGATATQVAYSALNIATPGWLVAAIAVLAYLSIPIVGLARANAPKP